MRHGLSLSKSQRPSDIDEIKRMSSVPYALTIGSIIYAMICTRYMFHML